ncbi:hypothetical protein JMJ77_0008771, partial [Colletotrichum scovillei]
MQYHRRRHTSLVQPNSAQSAWWLVSQSLCSVCTNTYLHHCDKLDIPDPLGEGSTQEGEKRIKDKDNFSRLARLAQILVSCRVWITALH